MTVTSLVDNNTNRDEFKTEHGLSLYIETKNHKILFDTGQSDLFQYNAEATGSDLENVDIAILSHGHYDHGGGLKKFLEINSKATVYIHEKAFGMYYSGKDKYIGLDQELRSSDRIIFTNKNLKLDDGIELVNFNEFTPKNPLSNENMNVLTENGMIPDIFEHEQYLVIKENKKKVVFSGCSHKGILNISEWLDADCIFGGFHLKNTELNDEGKAKLTEIAKILKKNNTQYYTCHCTGIEQYKFMKELMSDNLFYMYCGSTLYIS